MGFLNIEKKQEDNINVVHPQGWPIPHYNPEGRNVDLEGCFDQTRYIELCKEIDTKTDLSDEMKKFLKLCASRWIVFDYPNFAEYYCKCKDPEEKRIMEELALVIIDENNNISEAYSKYQKYLDEVVNNDKQLKQSK